MCKAQLNINSNISLVIRRLKISYLSRNLSVINCIYFQHWCFLLFDFCWIISSVYHFLCSLKIPAASMAALFFLTLQAKLWLISILILIKKRLWERLDCTATRSRLLSCSEFDAGIIWYVVFFLEGFPPRCSSRSHLSCLSVFSSRFRRRWRKTWWLLKRTLQH